MQRTRWAQSTPGNASGLQAARDGEAQGVGENRREDDDLGRRDALITKECGDLRDDLLPRRLPGRRERRANLAALEIRKTDELLAARGAEAPKQEQKKKP